MSKNEIIDNLINAILDGDDYQSGSIAKRALDSGIDYKVILNTKETNNFFIRFPPLFC